MIVTRGSFGRGMTYCTKKRRMIALNWNSWELRYHGLIAGDLIRRRLNSTWSDQTNFNIKNRYIWSLSNICNSLSLSLLTLLWRSRAGWSFDYVGGDYVVYVCNNGGRRHFRCNIMKMKPSWNHRHQNPSFFTTYVWFSGTMVFDLSS